MHKRADKRCLWVRGTDLMYFVPSYVTEVSGRGPPMCVGGQGQINRPATLHNYSTRSAALELDIQSSLRTKSYVFQHCPTMIQLYGHDS